MKERVISVLQFLFLLAGVNCVEQVHFKSIDHTDKLVVEGFISNQMKAHQVKLTKTSSIDVNKVTPEEGATVRLVIGKSFTIKLNEVKPGVYQTQVFAGTTSTVYKLLITTKDGKEYESEEVAFKNVPPITKIYAKFPYVRQQGTNRGIQIFLDTEDPTNQTRYYRWEYEQTYEIVKPFKSRFVWLGENRIGFRALSVDHCWASDTLSTILIKSTTGLEQDKVTEFPIKFIPEFSNEMAVKYSINVKQYPLTAKSYAYWKNLRDINETQGSLYDIQPGEITGNIICTSNPEESVLGYFDAGALSEMRVFYTPSDFEKAGYIPPDTFLCSGIKAAEIPANKIGEYMTQYGQYQEIIDALGSGPAFYTVLPKSCCDCTDKGTNVLPSFWR